MEFKDKVVIVTGGAKGIGAEIVKKFREKGALVAIIDICDNDYFVGNLENKETIEQFISKVIKDYHHIDYIINNAKPQQAGIFDSNYDDFLLSLKVGVAAPFYLVKLAIPYLNKNAAIVNISSSRDKMSQENTEGYTSAKGAISALTHALAMSLRNKARVNSISPGWIDTTNSELSLADLAQHPSNSVGKPEDIANLVLFLCSEKAKFINAENILVDGGMSHQMIYHNDYGWTYNK